MSLKKFLDQHNGKWEDGVATFVDRGGYIIRLATGDENNYELTWDGKRLIGEVVVVKSAPAPLANTSTSHVESRKRGKTAKPELDLDDL